MKERTVIAWCALALGWGFGTCELATAGDAVAAFALDDHARSPGTDADVSLDAAEALATIRPWQPEYREARIRLEQIERARREAAAHR